MLLRIYEDCRGGDVRGYPFFDLGARFTGVGECYTGGFWGASLRRDGLINLIWNFMSEITCFKAYDIRGQLGTQLDENVAYRIARAFAQWLKPKQIVLGGDVRESSEALKTALTEGLRDEGVDVLDLGLAGTEEVYFATFHLGVDGGIEVTASHNPIDYNGLKLVREGSRADLRRYRPEGDTHPGRRDDVLIWSRVVILLWPKTSVVPTSVF
ncbi:hypothetical protein ULF88_01660 [Halopseudomonas pachastrellae]|nr:hypothetical protein [Halopseudomonas pachastrellae]